MKITPFKGKLEYAPNAPHIIDPVVVTLDVSVYYVTERGLVSSNRGIVVSRVFAETVLAAQEEEAKQYGFGIAHVGFFVSRPARDRQGRDFLPLRWSNHAKGCGEDFKGYVVTDAEGQPKLVGIQELKRTAPAKFTGLLKAVRAKLKARGLREEIVDEGTWVHLGLYP